MSRTVQNILQNNCKDYHAVPDDSFIWTAKWLMCFHSSSLTTFKVLAVYLFSCYIWSRSHWRCSAYKKIFSKISQNSQESICVGVSFLRKLQAEDQQPYWKRNSGAGVFQWLLQNFSKTAFYRIPLGDCFFMLERWAWSFIFTMVYERKRLLEKILVSYTLSDFNCINCHHMLQSRPHAFLRCTIFG